MTTESVVIERRSGQRFQLHLPVSIHVAGRNIPGFTQDVSARGLFLYTEIAFEEGAAVDLTFTMPSEITLAESMRVRCQGRVLRAGASTMGTTRGVAVQLDSYEYLPSVECPTKVELAEVSVAPADAHPSRP